MRRGGLFWGAVLILIGFVLLLENLGFFEGLGISAWGLLWPALLILLGLFFLWGTLFGRRSPVQEELDIPSQGVNKGRVELNHGAGRLTIRGGAAPENLMEGIFSNGVDHHSRLSGDLLDVDFKVPTNSFFLFPFAWGPEFGHDWSIRLNPDIKTAIDLRTGANEARLDLSDLQVTDLRLRTGASSTEVNLPVRAGYTRVDIESGAASVTLRVPENVAARIQASGGLAEIKIDQTRFPRQGNGYQSPGYDLGTDKADIIVETGVGTVKVI
jgi:hypothetical protein